MTNKVETFLSTAGKDLLKLAEFVEGISSTVVKIVPAAASGVSTVVSDLEDIKTIVVDVEAISNVFATTPGGAPLTGAQKLAVAFPKIQQLVLLALMKGLKIRDTALFSEGVTDIGTGVVKCINAAEPATKTIATQDIGKS